MCFHRHVRTVWVCAVAIPLHSVSRSPKPHQRACGRQNDKARNQSASACSHTQTDTCSRTDTHIHTVILTNRFITLTHLLIDTRCLLHTTSVILSPLLHTHTAARTHIWHQKSSPQSPQWSPFMPRTQCVAEGDVCVYLRSHRQTLTVRRMK